METLKHYMRQYLDSNPRITSEATEKKYLSAEALFSRHIERDALACDLTEDRLIAFGKSLMKARGVKAVSVNGYLRALHALWEYLARKRIVTEFPLRKLFTEEEPRPVAWTRDEIRRLLATIEQLDDEIEGVPARDYWKAFHLLMALNGGERTGAVLAIESNWFDPNKAIIEVPPSSRKGKSKRMTYRLRADTYDAVMAIYDPKRKYLFPWTKSKTWFYETYKKLLAKAGLPNDRAHMPQALRRSFATHLLNAGGNPTKALRHSSPSTTEKFYYDQRLVKQTNEASLIPGF